MNTHPAPQLHLLSTTLLLLSPIALLLSGCPYPGGGATDLDYAAGFAVGFAEDAKYWEGYDDSMATVDAGPIYYQGSSIPAPQEPPYDQGYWDGVWYAYNDGYFVAYDYAFIIGFSEGYDVTFNLDGYTFLSLDTHLEYLDGGFSDGYNDGFSEGRIFGAADYEQGLTFDWLDALAYYREGNDLYFEELELGTGEYGPVELYIYGTDPAATAKSSASRLRNTPKSDEPPALSYRSLPETQQNALKQTPGTSLRSERSLTLDTTWLARINAYNALFSTNSKSAQPRQRTLR